MWAWNTIVRALTPYFQMHQIASRQVWCFTLILITMTAYALIINVDMRLSEYQ